MKKSRKYLLRTLSALFLSVVSFVWSLTPLFPVQKTAFSYTPGSLAFDGTASHIEIPDSSSLDLTSNMTVEAWVKLTTAPSHKHILGKKDYELSVDRLTTGFKANFEITVRGVRYVISSGQYAFNQWYHIAGSYDGSTMRLFVNGVKVKTKSVAGTITTNTLPLRIASSVASNDYYRGLIDEVRLSSSVRYIYNFTPSKSPFVPDGSTVGLWHFDEGSGTKAYDASGYGNNGTHKNSPRWSTATPLTSNDIRASEGEWSQAMDWPLVAVHTSLLPNGKILMWDAWEKPTANAKVWDPVTNTFSSVPVNSAIFCAGHAADSQGRVITVGGHVSGNTGIKDVNVFDPLTNTWFKAPDMEYARWYPSVTKLPDGRMLTLSGEIETHVFADIPEIYDPVTNSLTKLNNVNTSAMHEVDYPFPYVLPDGKLFVVAPHSTKSFILDVVAQSWTESATPPSKNGTSVMYRSGKVLYTGGGETNQPSITQASIIDVNQTSPQWTMIKPMNHPRFLHNLVMLPDGKVLSLGGMTQASRVALTGSLAAELWDPDTGGWTSLASSRDPRGYHSSALLLPDGRVLIAGGGRFSTSVDYLTAEIYSPPYLFKGSRPTISSVPLSAGYGSSITVQTPDAANIQKVTLINLGSNTHAVDFDQRYLELAFTKGSGSLSVTMPANSTLAPAGYYFLFINNTSGIPSIAKIIKVG